MFRVVRLAEAVRERYGIDGVASVPDVDKALAGEGMRTFVSSKLPLKINGCHFDGVAVVRAGLSAVEASVVKLHELGHFLIHEANGLYLASIGEAAAVDEREREAQVFAGVALVGPPTRWSFDERLKEAEAAGVPTDFLYSFVAALIVSTGQADTVEPEPPRRGDWLRQLPGRATFLAAMLAGLVLLHDLNGDGVIDAVATGMMHASRMLA